MLLASSFDSGRTLGQALALVVFALLAVGLLLRARVTRRRWQLLAGLAVLGALAAVGIARVGSGDSADTFASGHGRQLHAGFISGCRRSAGGVVDCDCVWRHLTSAPPYDRPSGFEKLVNQVGGSSAPPPKYAAAVAACRRSS